LLPHLSEPLAALVVGVTSASASALVESSSEVLPEFLRWPLEWLQTRGFTVPTGLEVKVATPS
jgi:hypothetical protein